MTALRKTSVMIGVIVFFLAISIFVHEVGHFLAARYCGVEVDFVSVGLPVERISLTFWQDASGTRFKINPLLLGGVTVMEKDGWKNLQTFPKTVAYLAGCIFTFLFALSLIFLYFLLKKSGLKKFPQVLRWIKLASFWNLFIGLLNLLVVFPNLDGGKILWLFLTPWLGNKAPLAGFIMGFPMIIFALSWLEPRLKKLYRIK